MTAQRFLFTIIAKINKNKSLSRKQRVTFIKSSNGEIVKNFIQYSNHQFMMIGLTNK